MIFYRFPELFNWAFEAHANGRCSLIQASICICESSRSWVKCFSQWFLWRGCYYIADKHNNHTSASSSSVTPSLSMQSTNVLSSCFFSIPTSPHLVIAIQIYPFIAFTYCQRLAKPKGGFTYSFLR